MNHLLFIELGLGADLHGQDVTRAAVRAAQDAIHRNSLPGLRAMLPSGDPADMRVRVRLGVPVDPQSVDADAVRAVFPFGTVEVECVPGGLLTSSGVAVPELGDRSDQAIVVVAAVEVGY